jgi:hypothetical protein
MKLAFTLILVALMILPALVTVRIMLGRARRRMAAEAKAQEIEAGEERREGP